MFHFLLTGFVSAECALSTAHQPNKTEFISLSFSSFDDDAMNAACLLTQSLAAEF